VGIPMEAHRGLFSVSTDRARLDLDAIHAFLSRSYWATGIPRSVVERSIQGSLCFGVYAAGQQVGFARIITDEATYAYLADVYVLQEYRGQGLATWLMEVIMAHPALQGLRRFALVTRDAHGLYSRLGFRSLQNPENHMEIRRADAYAASRQGVPAERG
jgi:GNAT superfamily N-acetyltransferase